MRNSAKKRTQIIQIIMLGALQQQTHKNANWMTHHAMQHCSTLLCATLQITGTKNLHFAKKSNCNVMREHKTCCKPCMNANRRTGGTLQRCKIAVHANQQKCDTSNCTQHCGARHGTSNNGCNTANCDCDTWNVVTQTILSIPIFFDHVTLLFSVSTIIAL